MRAYLELHQVEVAAFHPLRHKRMTFAIRRSQRLVSVALFLALYLAAFSGRSLTVTPLYGVRTVLPSPLARRPATVWLASTVIVQCVRFFAVRTRVTFDFGGAITENWVYENSGSVWNSGVRVIYASRKKTADPEFQINYRPKFSTRSDIPLPKSAEDKACGRKLYK